MVTAAANLVDVVTAFEDTNNGQTTQGGTQDTALARYTRACRRATDPART
jgi:hypothetical protein